MKLFCEDCKKTFQVSDEALQAGKAACPVCNREYTLSDESGIFPGRVIGDFVIESTIGKGGMGDIYCARQISLDREVALKILQSRFTDEKEYVEGLFHEARAAAKVSHPNIVQAYAVGEEDGIFYFAMELIRGETFKQIIQREKIIAPDRALKVVREIAGAIDAAWREQRLVHQDIKPDNIMLDSNGFAKLADLGLARKAGVNDEHAQAGDEVFGTPQYISPEQLTGVPTDVRSDIYSLGATFYQMVTGRYAYVADTVEEMSHKHVEGNLEPPNTVNPDIPDSVNAIIMKMMARKIDERYQTPQELIKDIDDALKGKSISLKKSPPSLSLKLKRGGVADKKKEKVTPAAPAGVKKAAPVAPVSPVAVKKAEPVAPVAPVAVKKAEPAAPAVEKAETAPAGEDEAKKNVAAEENKEQTAAAEKTAQEKQESTNSVRSALIAKHTDDEAVEEEKQELEELIASAPGKKSKKWVAVTLIVTGVLLLIALTLAIVLTCCAGQSWIPSFIQPVAGKMNEAVSGFGTNLKQKINASARSRMQKKEVVPEKKVPQTRKEFMDKVEKFLSLYRNSPDRKKEWHAAMQPELEYFMAPQTEEERRTVKPLLLIWHNVDEIIVFAPHRNAIQEKYQAKIRKAEEAERLAKEKIEQERIREEKRRAEEQVRMERDRQRIEEERKQNLDKLQRELDSLVKPLIAGAVEVFKGGDNSAYETALQNTKQYFLPHATNNEEQKAIDKYKADLKAINNCVADFRKFTASIADVSEKVITIRVKKGKRNQLVQMLGISADGVLKYKPFDGKVAETHLKNQRGIALATPLRVMKHIKNVDFYVLLMSERPVSELKSKAPSGDWKRLFANFAKAF